MSITSQVSSTSEEINYKDFILKIPKEIKIKCLKDSLEKKELGIFFGLVKILLDAPISEGGISSSEIDIIHKEYDQSKP
jgi:hypothetical protein